jgi:hypothetical protein
MISFCTELKTNNKAELVKNVTEERNASWQIILGSMDAAFWCICKSIVVENGTKSEVEPEQGIAHGHNG